MIAPPTGQTELLEGEVVAGGDARTLRFDPSLVHNTSTAEHVHATGRAYIFNPERTSVSARFDMGAVGQLSQPHLESELIKRG